MKKIIVVILLLLTLSVVGCEKKVLDVTPPKMGKPIFYTLEKDASIFMSTRTLISNPEGLERHWPDKFKIAKIEIFSGEYITIAHMLISWNNFYIYEDDMLKFCGIPTGAVAEGSSKKVLALAKMVELIKGEGMIIEEYHLDSKGRVYYWCRRKHSFGNRIEILEEKGERKTHYFAEWPSDTRRL